MLCSNCSGVGYTYGGYKACYGCGGSGHGAYTNVACMSCGGSGRSSERETFTCYQCHGSGHLPDPPSYDAPSNRSGPKRASAKLADPGSGRRAGDPQQGKKSTQGFWTTAGLAAGAWAAYHFNLGSLEQRPEAWVPLVMLAGIGGFIGFKYHAVLNWIALIALLAGAVVIVIRANGPAAF